MQELKNEDVKKFREWSEGNRELFELFCLCKKCNIKTFSSCGGHPIENLEEVAEHGVDPYVAIVLDSNSINYIEKIISELRDVSEVEIDVGYMKAIDTKCFDVHALPSNCSEIFYKMKLGIMKQQLIERGEKFEKKKPRSLHTYFKERQLIDGAKKIVHASDTELSKIEQNEYMLNSISNAFKKFCGNISLVRYFKTEISIPKAFMTLYEKYGKLQKQYVPDEITCFEDIRAHVINSQFRDAPVDLCVRPELENEVNKTVWGNIQQRLLIELQSRGIPFEVEHHSRNHDSSYYTRAEKSEDGLGRYIIDIPEGLEHSSKDNLVDSRDLFEYVYSMMHEYRHVMQRKEYCFGTKDTEEKLC